METNTNQTPNLQTPQTPTSTPHSHPKRWLVGILVVLGVLVLVFFVFPQLYAVPFFKLVIAKNLQKDVVNTPLQEKQISPTQPDSSQVRNLTIGKVSFNTPWGEATRSEVNSEEALIYILKNAYSDGETILYSYDKEPLDWKTEFAELQDVLPELYGSYYFTKEAVFTTTLDDISIFKSMRSFGVSAAALLQKNLFALRIPLYKFETDNIKGFQMGNPGEESIWIDFFDKNDENISYQMAIGGATQDEIDYVISSIRFIEPVDTTGWQTYRNEEFGYELMLPGEWSVAVDQQDESIRLISPARRDILEQPESVVTPPSDVSVNILHNNYNSLTDFINDYNNGWFNSYEKISNINIASINALDADDRSSKINHFPVRAIFIQKNERVIMLSLFWIEDPEGKNIESIFDQILSTFKFIE